MRMSFSQKNNNCAGTAFVQGDSVGGSKFTEQTILVNSKPDHLPGRGFARSREHCQGVGFSFSFLCRGGRGFEFEKFSIVLEEKCRKLSICFKETGSRLKSGHSCAVSCQFLQKQ